MDDKKEKKLTGKEEAFIQHYCSNGWNGTQAAISAGYSVHSAAEIAYEILRKPQIVNSINDYKKLQGDINNVKISDIIADLQEIKERCMTKEPVMEYDKDAKCMVETGEWAFKEVGALKAIELIGKTIGAFTDVIDTKGDQTIKIELVNPIEKDV